jgi:DNA-binding MarR family transcriptional regulator
MHRITTEPVSPVDAWEALFRAQVAMMRQLTDEFPSEVISFNEYDALFNLSRARDYTLRIRDLNEEVLLTQPSISRLIDRLAQRGLVTKCIDPHDGRGTLVSLTDEGFTLFRNAAKIHARSIASRMSDNLDRDELAELARLTRKLHDGLRAR